MIAITSVGGRTHGWSVILPGSWHVRLQTDAMSSHPYPKAGPTRYLFGAGPMDPPDSQVFW